MTSPQCSGYRNYTCRWFEMQVDLLRARGWISYRNVDLNNTVSLHEVLEPFTFISANKMIITIEQKSRVLCQASFPSRLLLKIHAIENMKCVCVSASALKYNTKNLLAKLHWRCIDTLPMRKVVPNCSFITVSYQKFHIIRCSRE